MKIQNKPQYLYVGILIHCYSVKQTDGKKQRIDMISMLFKGFKRF